MPPKSDLPVPDGGPRLYGVMDVLRLGRVAGWVIDRTDSTAAVEVEILREGRPVATVRADRHRQDLARTGVGTGRYGFAATLDPPLEPGFEFTISAIARTADGEAIELKRPGARGGGSDPDRRLLERIHAAVSELRAARPAAPPVAPAPVAGLAEIAQRLEVTQARIEAALASVEAPPAPAQGGLRLVIAIALAMATGSLAIGIWSLLH